MPFQKSPFGFKQAYAFDTEIKAKRNNMSSECINFRITKAESEKNVLGKLMSFLIGDDAYENLFRIEYQNKRAKATHRFWGKQLHINWRINNMLVSL